MPTNWLKCWMTPLSGVRISVAHRRQELRLGEVRLLGRWRALDQLLLAAFAFGDLGPQAEGKLGLAPGETGTRVMMATSTA